MASRTVALGVGDLDPFERGDDLVRASGRAPPFFAWAFSQAAFSPSMRLGHVIGRVNRRHAVAIGVDLLQPSIRGPGAPSWHAARVRQ